MNIQDLLKNVIFWWVFWGGLCWAWIYFMHPHEERVREDERKGCTIFFILVAIAGLVAMFVFGDCSGGNETLDSIRGDSG